MSRVHGGGLLTCRLVLAVVNLYITLKFLTLLVTKIGSTTQNFKKLLVWVVRDTQVSGNK